MANFQAQMTSELREKLLSAGYEQLQTLGRWKALDAVGWDALGECLAVQFHAGKPEGIGVPVAWQIPRAEALVLLRALERAFEEKGTEEMPRQ